MTRKERVIKAIKFDNPDQVPIFFVNRDQRRGDVLYCSLFILEDGISEWGYHWKNLDDGTMGQPEKPVLPTWDLLKEFSKPKSNRQRRLGTIEEFKKQAGDYYLLGGLGITGFTTYTFLRGFENAMMDFIAGEKDAFELLDLIFSFENDLISLAAEAGFNAVHFEDDWGTQDGLIISPELWRRIFKPRYKKQFEYAHSLGLDVWFHCCGNITSIIPDFHEISVDVMNISQPNVVDIAKVGNLLHGKQCFMAPISYQTVSISGTPADIYTEAERLYRELGGKAGGFIGYIEDYSCMGMSQANYTACEKAFRDLE